MIDTVVLRLKNHQYTIKDMSVFDGINYKKRENFVSKTYYCKSYPDQQKNNGLYFPMISILNSKGGHQDPKSVLEIQVSLPKLMYGTNFFEVDKPDINIIYQKFLSILNQLGIETSVDQLKLAIVKRADFSKMIILPEYLGKADYVINKLLRFNYKPKAEFSCKEFRGKQEGVYLKFYNKAQGYVIYDKIGEILNNGYTSIEKKLIKQYKDGEIKNNVLRFELSFHRKDSFDAFVNKRISSDKKRDFLLQDIFNKKLAKNILLDAFDKVFGQVAIGLITLSEMEDNKLRDYLENSGMGMSKQIKLYYWARMTTTNGVNGAWEHLRSKYNGNSITRVRKEIAMALQELGNISGNTPNLIAFLRKEHEEFEMIKPKRA